MRERVMIVNERWSVLGGGEGGGGLVGRGWVDC